MWLVSVMLGNSATAPPRSASPSLDQPCDSGELAGLREVQHLAAVAAVPEDADHVGARRRGVVPLRARPPVECGTVGVPQPLQRYAGQVRQRRPHVDQPGVVVDVTQPLHARAAEDERGPGLDGVERAVLADVPALVGEVVPRAVHDRQVGAPVGVGEEGQQPPGGQRVGVVRRPLRRRVGQLALIGEERQRVLAADRVLPGHDLRRPVEMEPHPAHAVGGEGDPAVRPVLHPADQVDDVGQLRPAQGLDERLA
ncbi:hypothetical protein [Nocardioides sp.]|uniref:hypothetical protein n=1 Tax=Nocardioides sp. TaxID=35761 RepID=UPI003528F7E5